MSQVPWSGWLSIGIMMGSEKLMAGIITIPIYNMIITLSVGSRSATHYAVLCSLVSLFGMGTTPLILGTGPFYGEAANKVEQNAYATVNLRLGYEWRDFDISFWMENVFDKQYCTFLSPFQQSIVGIDGPPRTFGATAVWRF